EGDRFLDDHGAVAVVGGRWLPVARFTVAWLAGINRMPWPTFFLWNAVGGVTWVVTVGLAAYYIGHRAQSAITALGLVGLLGLVIALIGHGIWTRRSHPARRPAEGSG
ncbi:MAG TPA: VTT domain-containing protein, partial [Gaiellales bacterium]|nr:VTT domain-containing protein [Gaiellales bacterium]